MVPIISGEADTALPYADFDGGTIPVYGDGSNIRDWLYVEDHARGIASILESGKLEVYNIGGHNECESRYSQFLCRMMDERFTQTPELTARFPNAPQAKETSVNRSLSPTVPARLAVCH